MVTLGSDAADGEESSGPRARRPRPWAVVGQWFLPPVLRFVAYCFIADLQGGATRDPGAPGEITRAGQHLGAAIDRDPPVPRMAPEKMPLALLTIRLAGPSRTSPLPFKALTCAELPAHVKNTIDGDAARLVDAALTCQRKDAASRNTRRARIGVHAAQGEGAGAGLVQAAGRRDVAGERRVEAVGVNGAASGIKA